MFGSQQQFSAIVILVIVKAVVTKSFCFPPAICVELKKCEPYMDLIGNMEKPLQLPVTKFLKARMCGFEEDEPKVCCSSLPRSLPSNLLLNKQLENRKTKKNCEKGFECVDLTECSPLVYLLNLGETALKVIKSQHCGFGENNARVCCKLDSSITPILSHLEKKAVAKNKRRGKTSQLVNESLRKTGDELNRSFDMSDFFNFDFYDLFRRKRHLVNSSDVDIEIR